jgi:DNA-binding LacI/PurR family transcriptional regulator
MAKRVTLKEVARAAGVSHITVSRVVRRELTVKATTVEKVNRFLHKMGYQPDPVLSALSAYRVKGWRPYTGKVLAFLETDKSAYNLMVLAGARNEAAQLGYSVESFELPVSAKGQNQMGRQLFYRGIQGMLISPSSEPRRLDGWTWSRFAPVSLGALRHEPPMHAVAMDYFHGLQTAYRGLQKMGFKRIGLVLREDLEARTGHLWLGAYLAIGKPVMAPLLFTTRKANAEQALRQWRTRHRPDAVLTIHRDWHETFSKAGITCAYLNDVAPEPGSPYIRLDPGHIGREGVQLVHRLLQKQELGLPELPKMILLRGEWDAKGRASLPEFSKLKGLGK